MGSRPLGLLDFIGLQVAVIEQFLLSLYSYHNFVLSWALNIGHYPTLWPEKLLVKPLKI